MNIFATSSTLEMALLLTSVNVVLHIVFKSYKRTENENDTVLSTGFGFLAYLTQENEIVGLTAVHRELL